MKVSRILAINSRGLLKDGRKHKTIVTYIIVLNKICYNSRLRKKTYIEFSIQCIYLYMLNLL